MNDWSRRSMLRATAGVAIAVPMAALVAGPASAATVTGAAGGGAEGSPHPTELAGPVMFCVHDPKAGKVSILHGTHEVVVTDHQLVARILSAAAAA
jgi:hypothetical protein